MADDKGEKKDKKPEGEGGGAFGFFDIDSENIALLVLLIIVSTGFIGYYYYISKASAWLSALLAYFYGIAPILKLASLTLTFLFAAGIIYLVFKMNKILAEEKKKLYLDGGKGNTYPSYVPEDRHKNLRWEKIEKHMQSDSPNEWKLAILEADIMLGDMLEEMGYLGESIGEMLKNVEKSDFDSLDEAWEAHKIRNSIAHEGSEFVINRREADRVVALYKKVFQEFKFI